MLSVWLLHEDVDQVLRSRLLRPLLRLLVDCVVVVSFDEGIDDHRQKAVLSLNLCVHCFKFLLWKPLLIKREEVVVFRFRVMLRPREVHPEHVDWEFVNCEFLASRGNDVCRHLGVLAEVEAESVQGRQLGQASN